MITNTMPGFTADAVFETVTGSYQSGYSGKPTARNVVQPQIINNGGNNGCPVGEARCTSIEGGAGQCCPEGWTCTSLHGSSWCSHQTPGPSKISASQRASVNRLRSEAF
jgi:hypothetical protein